MRKSTRATASSRSARSMRSRATGDRGMVATEGAEAAAVPADATLPGRGTSSPPYGSLGRYWRHSPRSTRWTALEQPPSTRIASANPASTPTLAITTHHGGKLLTRHLNTDASWMASLFLQAPASFLPMLTFRQHISRQQRFGLVLSGQIAGSVQVQAVDRERR